VTELEPLFRLLVQRLAAQSPARVHQPVAINELMDAVLPYRLVRRELGVDTAEDYEALLLQLCAGEGGFVQGEAAAQAALHAELARPLPDLTLLRVYGDTHVVLRIDPARSVMVEDPETRYAPPGTAAMRPAPPEKEAEPTPEPEVEPEAPSALPVDPVIREAIAETPAPAHDDAGGRVRCPFCGGALPARVMINFCPHCGMGQDVGKCHACGADMDMGWRFCVACGEEAGEFPA